MVDDRRAQSLKLSLIEFDVGEGSQAAWEEFLARVEKRAAEINRLLAGAQPDPEIAED
jgi:hypothetical protein